MPPLIFRTPDVSKQFPFPLEVRNIGIPVYYNRYLSYKLRTVSYGAVTEKFAADPRTVHYILLNLHTAEKNYIPSGLCFL